MRPEDVSAYLARDWELVRKLKQDYWADRKGSMTPEEALGIADALLRQTKAFRPNWPEDSDREADLATHIRVSEALRRVSATPRR